MFHLIRRGEFFAEYALGDVSVTVLSDGYADFSHETLKSKDQSLLAKVPLFDGNMRLQVNAFLIRCEQRSLLIDVGASGGWYDSAGKLHVALDEAKVSSDSIHTIALTHSHIDHIGGLLMPAGDVAYKNANEILINERELDLAYTKTQLAPIFSRFKTFRGGDTVFPCVEAVPAYGHSPGHTAFLVRSKGENLLIWGDIIHAPSLQFEHPEVTWEYDATAEDAAHSRMQFLERAVAEDLIVAGSHHDFPGLCRIAKDGKSYRNVRV